MKKIQFNHWTWHPRYMTGEPGTKVQVPWPCQQQTRTKLTSQDKPERVDGSTTTSWGHAPLSAPGFLDWMCRVSMTTRLKRSLGSGEDSPEVTVSFQRDRVPFTSFLFWDHVTQMSVKFFQLRSLAKTLAHFLSSAEKTYPPFVSPHWILILFEK